MNTLGQFFTPSLVTQRVVAGLSAIKPHRMLDLGIGNGELLAAADHRWPGARLLGADIDHEKVRHASCRLPNAHCVHADALRYDLPDLLGIKPGVVDLAVGNPPYGKFSASSEHQQILADVGLDNVLPLSRISREVVFLAQNLRLLRPGGELAVILPESIGTGHLFTGLRRALMERHGLWRVMELPAHLFRGTEAKTLAFFLRKGGNSPQVHLDHWHNEQTVVIGMEQAVRRLDASFHLVQKSAGQYTLAALTPDIQRGHFSNADAVTVGTDLFHTTRFRAFPDGRLHLNQASPLVSLPPRWLAQPGDVLIPRVGTRCMEYAAIVQSGSAPFTDCIYRIRVAPQWQERLVNYLRSSEGVASRLALSHGVCARVLSRSDLLELPLHL